MKINAIGELPQHPVEMDGAREVYKRILVGPDDGSTDIIMRLFTVKCGGHTPRHKHNFEHLVKIEAGRGMVIDPSGAEHEVAAGHSIFVAPNEEHQFKNPFRKDFEFICVIPNPKKG